MRTRPGTGRHGSGASTFARTSLLHETWDTTGSVWKSKNRHTFTLDGSGHTTVDLAETWNGSAWVNNSQTLYTYDGSGNQTEYLFQSWNGSAWTNVSRTGRDIPSGF